MLGAGTALDPLLTLVTQHALHDDALVAETYGHVLRRKGMAIEALSAERSTVYGGKHPALSDALHALRELRETIARATLAGPGPEGAEAYLVQLDAFESERREQEIALARDIPELALSARLRMADVASVHAALPAGAALIDFVQFTPLDLATGARAPARLVAFTCVSGGDARVSLIDLGAADAIATMIAAFRISVTGHGNTRDVEDAEAPATVQASTMSAQDGVALRAAIVDTVLATCGGARRLFIAPDGALHRLPFEILPLADGRRLIDEYTVSYLGAGRDVLRFGTARSGRAGDSVVVADPDFDLRADNASSGTEVLQRTGLHFARLAGTRTEGEQVATLLGVRSFCGADATERVVKGAASPRILHLATHGFFLAERSESAEGAPPAPRLKGRLENPMLRSGLALAGANTWLANGALPEGAEDALLNGEDVSGMDLVATDLVVLSACESGLGEIQAGEGVFGLRRAFVLAGAATLVVSLWPVPDEQTQLLMGDFYGRLLAGAPRVEALRSAQLVLKATYPDPRWWGAFICIGDPGPLYRDARPD
jgi:CHAT domain-containing protein